jgi:hypothetical protein
VLQMSGVISGYFPIWRKFVFCLCWCSHLAGCRSWCSCRWLCSIAITNYQQGACTIARARYVVGVANAANPKHNTQQRQSVGFVYFFCLCWCSHLAGCRSWCSCRWLCSIAITNYQQSACVNCQSSICCWCR